MVVEYLTHKFENALKQERDARRDNEEQKEKLIRK